LIDYAFETLKLKQRTETVIRIDERALETERRDAMVNIDRDWIFCTQRIELKNSSLYSADIHCYTTLL